MEPGYSSAMEELEKIQQTLMQQIKLVRQADAKLYHRELQTSKAALKAIKQLLTEMKQPAA